MCPRTFWARARFGQRGRLPVGPEDRIGSNPRGNQAGEAPSLQCEIAHRPLRFGTMGMQPFRKGCMFFYIS